MASTDWRLEMHNMLVAFSRQATHSLGIIKTAFKQSGQSFTPEFKQHFTQASNNRIIETYDQFEINASLEQQTNINLNTDVHVSNESSDDNESQLNSIHPTNHVIGEASNQMDNTVQVDVATERVNIGRSEVKSEANDSASGSFYRSRSVGSSANTLGTVIQIDDSDGEEGAVQLPKMESTDGRATGNAASARNTGVNQKGKDKVKIGIMNEGNIKTKKEETDNDIPMIEIQVSRKVRVPIHEENTLGHASSSSFRTTNGNRSTIDSAHVTSELENQTLNNLIEIDDSSDEEGATERAHTSNESMREKTSQMGSLVDLSNAPSQVGRLRQSNISSTLAERANNINSFHISSTVVRRRNSTGSMDTSGKEKCVGPDDVGYVVIAPVGCENTDVTNSVRFINPMVVEGQNGTMNENRSRSGNNEGIDASKENRRRNTRNARLTDERQIKQRPATEKSTSNRLKCHLCKYIGRHMGHLKQHMQTHSGEKPYRCDRCERRFALGQNLKRHAVTHTDVFPFHCKGCSRTFSRKVEKKAHDKVCLARRYECHLCKKFVTSVKTLMKRHMRKHTGEKPFRCEICMTHFSQKWGLKRHLNTIHNRMNP